MRPFIFFTVLFFFSGCGVVRPRYTDRTDLQKKNLSGNVETVMSRYLDRPDDPDRSTEFDILLWTRYNGQGNIVSEETYGSGGTRLAKQDLYFYDESGLRLESCEYHDKINNRVSWVNYVYDDTGRIESFSSVPAGWKGVYDYDRKGYPVKLKTVQADTVSETHSFIYDGKGRLKKQIVGRQVTRHKYYKGHKPKKIWNSSQAEYYNRNGDLEKTVIAIRIHSDTAAVEKRDGVVTALLKYDSLGNWTSQKMYSDGEAYGMWVREIEYAEE